MSAVPGGPETEFPNYTRLPAYLPSVAWHALRAVSVASVFALVGVLIWRPEIGLTVAWGVIIPLAPLLFLAAPGVWRNVCPFAALNQLPRLAGFTRGLVQTPRLKEYAYVIGMAALLLLVATRKPVFDHSGLATAAAQPAVVHCDESIKRIVIVGNGIAGITAADFARRTHPRCEIHVVARERFALYNRMGITRLIYGRSAMQGLYLLPDAWYELSLIHI